MHHYFWVLLFLLLKSCSLSRSLQLQCLDENRKTVDWIYIYKFPKHASPHGDGLDYLYLHEKSGGWTLSDKTIDDVESIPGMLISQLNTSDLVIMYNDETPEDKTDGSHGHTKGVVAADNDSGFWLVHSVPKYPPTDFKKYSYPQTGHTYGQSFLCISLKSVEELETVGSQIAYNEPHVYLGQTNPTLEAIYPKLSKVATNSSWITQPPFHSTEKVSSFTIFSKSHKFNKELYVDWVAPALQTDLMVESWLHGSGVISSDCEKPFKVYNVEHISFPSPYADFTSMGDHSKWTVGKVENWICVGDINRADQQKHRGGGTVCRFDKYTADAYRSLIQSLYPCPRNDSLNLLNLD